MGVATVEIAKRLPDTDFLAIDVHGPGVGNILKLIEEEHISNIRVMRHDAVEVVEKMLEDGSLDGIHIFFPDPWHKKRHNKRRLVQVPFVEKLLPKLKSGGYVPYGDRLGRIRRANAGSFEQFRRFAKHGCRLRPYARLSS